MMCKMLNCWMWNKRRKANEYAKKKREKKRYTKKKVIFEKYGYHLFKAVEMLNKGGIKGTEIVE